MIGLRRLHREDEGMAMVIALMVVFVVTLLSIVVFDLSIHNTQQAAYDRKRVTSVAAAEAGIDEAWNRIQYTQPQGLPWGSPVTGALGSSPGLATYSVQYRYFDSTGAEMTSQPSQANLPSALLVTSTGQTNNGVPRTMQAYMTLAPTYGGFSSAIMAQTGVGLSNNFTLTGENGNDADVYVLNGNFTSTNLSNIYGNVYVPNGSASVSNSALIHGDLWANGVVSLPNNGNVSGDVTSSTSSVTVTNNSSVGGDARAGTTISVTNGSSVAGSQYPNSPQGPPPTQAFPLLCQVAISGVCSALPWTGYTISTFAGASACTTARTFLTSGTLTGDRVVWIDAVCNLNIQNNTTVNFTGNLAIVTQGSVTTVNNTTWNGASDKSLMFIVNHRTIFPAGCSASFNITISNNSRFNGASALFYTPCTAAMNNNASFKGQIMARTLTATNNFTMSGTRVLVPGISGVNGFDQSIVYVREVTL